MLKFKVGDTIKTTIGKDKGREGKIEKIDKKNLLAIVPGVNLYKKHVKASPTDSSIKGGIYEIPRALPFSKIALICPKCKKQTRAGFSTIGGSASGRKMEKIRVCKKCGKEIDSK